MRLQAQGPTAISDARGARTQPYGRRHVKAKQTYPTTPLAALARGAFGVRFLGSVVLNRFVGGLNPHAILGAMSGNRANGITLSTFRKISWPARRRPCESLGTENSSHGACELRRACQRCPLVQPACLYSRAATVTFHLCFVWNPLRARSGVGSGLNIAVVARCQSPEKLMTGGNSGQISEACRTSGAAQKWNSRVPS